MFFACLAPIFGPVWHRAFEPEIRDFQDYMKMRSDPLDPWGNPWLPMLDGKQSLGPNGVDEGGQGDDLVMSTLGRPIPPPEVAVYERAPADYLLAIALGLGSFLAARNLRRRSTHARELGLTLALAAPLIVATLWILYECWPYWRFAASFHEFLLAPAPLAAAGSVVLVYAVGVFAIRRSAIGDHAEARLLASGV